MNRFRQTSKCLTFAALLFSAGLALSQQVPLPPDRKKNNNGGEDKQTPSVSENKPIIEGLPAAVDPNSYKIGPEDVIRVVVWKEPELSFTGAVRPDGKVSAPLLGDLAADGQTPTALAAALKEKYGELVNNPLVNVEVVQVRSKKYYIIGQVGRTGMFPLVVPTTVLEALTMAGGMSEWADRKKIIVMRGEKRFTFNYDAAIKGNKGRRGKAAMNDNIMIENGDFIVVN
jgi:polysaccharide biosynthesis/export protein